MRSRLEEGPGLIVSNRDDLASLDDGSSMLVLHITKTRNQSEREGGVSKSERAKEAKGRKEHTTRLDSPEFRFRHEDVRYFLVSAH